MAFKLGLSAVLNYKVDGQDAGGSWVEATNVQDVTLDLDKDTADVTTRGNDGWEALVGTLKKASLKFKAIWDPDDAAFDAFMDAFLTDGAIIGFQVLDETSGIGLQADFMITKFSRAEPLREALTVDIEAVVTYSSTAPTWIGT